MSDAVNDTIVIGCKCGAKMRVRASAAGKKAKCPKCGGIVAIPGAVAASAPAVVVTHATKAMRVKPETPAALDDLLKMEESTAAESPASGTRCPQCKVLMTAGAKICISCGYNVETGKSLKTSDGSPGKLAVAAKTLGTLALGTVLSGAGAAVGGLAWFLVAHYAHFEVGYIAWGVGVLAGVGMYFGYRQPEAKAGVVAAGMAVLGIVGAKLAIFILAVSAELPIHDPRQSGIEEQRAFVAQQMVDEILDERGVKTEEQRQTQRDSALKEAKTHVEGMSDDEVRSVCKEYVESLEGLIGPNEFFIKGFIQSEFTLFDLLWFFLALGSAYRIGCGTPVSET